MSDPHIDFFETPRKPLPGHILFDGLQPPREIVLAVNPRTSLEEVVGVLKAAKDTGQIVILELALSECNRKGGYSGLTPSTFADRARKAADIVGWYGYILHADHVTIGRETHKITEAEISDVKRELEARIDAGFTSFAIDASYLFDRSAEKVKDQLRDVAEVSIEMFKHIEDKIGGMPFGKEGEVGEIGVTEFTTVEEGLFYLGELRKNGIELDCLAINNGSKHGVTLDAEGNVIPQLTVNLKRTIEIFEAARRDGYRTGIAQHGISGT
ncbi:MAG: class II fructose-bisphosphate aldolase, partial [Candidatus Bathyarchaeota archaeon]|nr:class II fructose-bisphosphate aldolase [Candidatus Bathyarchaeota archaeon]